MNGKLIVIEGLDGSGKATQTKLLYDALRAEREDVYTLSFPCYDDESSTLVRMYLSGEFGEHPDDVNGYAASVFFAVDRYASYKKNWHILYEGGAVLLADRYTTSNAVYQTAKLPREQWDGYLDWLFDFEYNRMGIPMPDAVIFLEVTLDTSYRLMQVRYQGDEHKKDIHEKDVAFQERSRAAAQYCARRQGWKCVQCDQNGAVRPAADIAREIALLVKEII